MKALDLDTAKRLMKFLELMSSEHDGEALSAARRAAKLIKDAGLSWPEVIIVGVPTPPIVRTPDSRAPHHNRPGGIYNPTAQDLYAQAQAQSAANASWRYQQYQHDTNNSLNQYNNPKGNK